MQEQAGGLKLEKKQNGQSQREIASASWATRTAVKQPCSTPLPGPTLKVANWPGVTVERVEGRTSYKGRSIKGH